MSTTNREVCKLVKEDEKSAISETLEPQEAGIADLIEFYEKVEGVYVEASTYTVEPSMSYASDSTNSPLSYAHVG